MSDGRILALLSIILTSVDGVIVTTPKQSVPWSNIRYTLLSTVGYSFAVSPFTFQVKTCSDAHIGLMKLNDPVQHGRIYEIGIGGWANTKSVLRSARQQNPAENTKYTSGILDCDQFRTFQIIWDNGGSVEVFKYETNMEIFLSWTDPSPFTVNYIGVTTGSAGIGVWNITIPVSTTTAQTTTSTVSSTTTPITTATDTTTTNTDTTTTAAAATTTTTTTAAAATTTTTTAAAATTNTTTTAAAATTNTTTTAAAAAAAASTTTTTTAAATTTTTPSSPDTTTTYLTGSTKPETDDLTTTSTSTQETNSSESSTLCSCKCVEISINYTQEQLEDTIQKLRTELLVVKSKTSKAIRSKISANDSRTSSKVMGSVACVVLVVIFGGLILLDIPNLIVMCQSINTMKHRGKPR